MTDPKETEEGNTETGEAESAEFTESVSAGLRMAVEALPQNTSQRLRQIRHEAVEIAGGRYSWWLGNPFRMLIASTALVLLAVVMLPLENTLVPSLPLASETELALAQDLDLLEELEFLAWLETETLDAG